MGWLEILGVIFLVILCVLAYFGFKIYRFFRNSVDSNIVKAYEILPPIRMEFYPLTENSWKDKDRYKKDNEFLTKTGFQLDGIYETFANNVRTVISLWLNPKNRLIAVIYEASATTEDPSNITFYASELYLPYSDGSSITVTNNTHANTLPREPKHKMVMFDSSDFKELFLELKKHIAKDKKVKAIKNVRQHFMDVASEMNSWVWQKDQLKSEQVRDLFAQQGIALTEELVEELVVDAEAEKSMLLSDKIIQIFTEKTNISAAKWESMRDRVVVVHEKMSADDLVSCFYQLVEDMSDSDTEKVEAIEELDYIACPVTLFSSRLTQLRCANRIKCIAKLKQPVLSHIYLPNTL